MNDVARFSIGSRVIYLSDDEAHINLNVTDSPRGIYTITVIPEITSSGVRKKYGLAIDSEFNRRLEKNDIDSELDSIDSRFDTIDIPFRRSINTPAVVSLSKYCHNLKVFCISICGF